MGMKSDTEGQIDGLARALERATRDQRRDAALRLAGTRGKAMGMAPRQVQRLVSKSWLNAPSDGGPAHG